MTPITAEGLPVDVIAFAKRYRLFLQLMSWGAWVLPKPLYPLLRRTIGRWANPYLLRSGEIMKGLYAHFSPDMARRAWLGWLDSHARFTLDFLGYDKLDASWLRRCVKVEDAGLLEALRQSGGLLLTYHSHHQNTMCCALGWSGCTVSAIAAAPEDSPLFSFIGRWAQRVNAGSEKHFRGGRYLFTNDKRQLARSIRQWLEEKKVLVSLCDFHQPATHSPQGHILGRVLSPPTGAIEVALKQGAPIYAAMFAPQHGQLRLQLTRLDSEGGLPAIISGYLAFLESCVLDNPCCWQGWDWFQELALSDKPLP